MKIDSSIQIVRQHISEFLQTSYFGVRGEGSDTPFDLEHRYQPSGRKLALSALVASFANMAAKEVGIVEKLRDLTIRLMVVTNYSDEEIEVAVLEAENQLIDKYFTLDGIEDLAFVDFETPFLPTRDQIKNSLTSLMEKCPSYVFWTPEIQEQMLNAYLRKVNLAKVDRKKIPLMRRATLVRLNNQFRFVCLHTTADSYAQLYLFIVGSKALSIHPDPRSVSSTIACGTLFLERTDAKNTRILKTPYVTSAERLQAHASRLPERFNLTICVLEAAIARTVMMLVALIRSDPQFTGRIGVKHTTNDHIEWVWRNVSLLSAPRFTSILPDKFRLVDDSTIEDLRSKQLNALSLYHDGFCDKKSSLPLLSSFYHLTHRNNLRSIFERGIISLSQIKSLGLAQQDISDHQVQRWRENVEPCYKRRIHDYVPLYINPRNPMLYVKREIQQQLVILVIDKKILSYFDHIYTDGNAASRDTIFSYGPSVLEKSMGILEAHFWHDVPDGKRRRCAELLVYPSIPPSFISCVLCSDKLTLSEIQSEIGASASVFNDLFF